MPAFLGLMVTSPTWAQSFSFGARAGVPLTSTLTAESPFAASVQHYAAGGAIQVDVSPSFEMGADFLVQGLVTASTVASRRWELPVTLRYQFLPRQPELFVRAGLSVNRVFDVHGAGAEVELRHRGTYGAVVGAGLHWRIQGIHLEPELRLTHWFDHNWGVHDAPIRSNLTQLEILLGLRFR